MNPCNCTLDDGTLCQEPCTSTCDICDKGMCREHRHHQDWDVATHGIEVTFCDRCALGVWGGKEKGWS